jgi:serine protease AprX
VNKDNAYGYGLPAMGTMLGKMNQASTPAQGGLEMFPMIMLMSMMARMVGGA